MEFSVPYEATRISSPETSPKVVHFSPPMQPTTYHKEEQKEIPPLPKQPLSQKLLCGFKFKRSKPKVPKKTVSTLPKRLPERKPLQTLTIADLTLSEMDASIEAQPYKWPHDGGFSPETTALVIIDMQKDFCSPDGYLVHQGYDITPVRTIIPTLQRLLAAFRTHNFPIYHTREGHRPDLSTLSSRELLRSRNNSSGLGIGDPGPLGRLLIRGQPGHAIIPELLPLQNENVIDKPGRSAFQHTEFKLMLDIKGIKNLILVGATTDVCVSSTMREANDNGFDCLLVEDATAASERQLHEGAVESVKAEGGIFGAVTTSDKILLALGVSSRPSKR